MTTLLSNGSTLITRLRIRVLGIDPLSAQLRVASLLNSASFHPRGLAPSSILCIRKLRDPLPGTLPLHGNNVGVSGKWERDLTASLEQLAQNAVRPAMGFVPANAEAVLFADRAELLACLARDYCTGSASAQWWWQSLLHGKDISRVLLSAWLEAPEYVPGVLQLLSESGGLVAFVRTLHDEAASAITQSLLQRFALIEIKAALTLAFSARDTLGSESNLSALADRAFNTNEFISNEAIKLEGESPQLHSHGADHSKLLAPWQRWAPESASSEWRFEQQCLLGLGLMLHRAPAIVRSRSFAQAVREWRRAEIATADSAVATKETRARITQTVPQDLSQLSESLLAPRLSRDEQFPAVSSQTENANAPFTSRSSPLAATPIITAHGGVFYLINLGLFLELYGDFTTPLQPGIDLSIWDFLALLGESFCGEKIKADPIWPLLAQLAGREEHKAPGKNFSPPEEWRLPTAWLKPFPQAGVWKWSIERGRLRVEHHENFCVLEVALEENVSAQLQRELQAYREAADITLQRVRDFNETEERTNLSAISRAREGSSRMTFEEKKEEEEKEEQCHEAGTKQQPSSLERWMNWLIPYLRARLLRALGLTNSEDLPRILCEHHARVFVSPTHLDIELSLAELPIALRLAGLDRNPGWVPAAGKHINFRF